MSKTVQQFYCGLLADPEASPALLEKVLRFGLKTKNVELLARLAAHPALTSEIDQQLAPLTYAKVKAAWAVRPERTPQVLDDLARNDKRVAVLEVLASLATLSPAGYANLTKVDSDKVATALVTNPQVPLEVKQKAACIIGRNAPTDSYRHYTFESKLSAVLLDHPELHDALGSESSSPAVFSFIASTPDLSAKVQVRLAKVAVKDGLQNASSAGWRASYAARSALETAAKMAANPGLTPEGAKALGEALTLTTTDSHTESLRKNALASLKSNTPTGKLGVSPVTAARTSTTLEELQGYADQAAKTHNRPLAAAVASNLLVTGDMIDLVAPSLDYYVSQRILQKRGLPLDVAVALLYAHNGRDLDEALARTGTPGKALVALTQRYIEAERAVPPAVATSRYVSAESVLLLPVSYLAMADLPVSTRKTVASALLQFLGGKIDRWEIFESICENYAGSLAELLDVVATLHPEEGDSAETPVSSEQLTLESDSEDLPEGPAAESAAESAAAPLSAEEVAQAMVEHLADRPDHREVLTKVAEALSLLPGSSVQDLAGVLALSAQRTRTPGAKTQKKASVRSKRAVSPDQLLIAM